MILPLIMLDHNPGSFVEERAGFAGAHKVLLAMLEVSVLLIVLVLVRAVAAQITGKLLLGVRRARVIKELFVGHDLRPALATHVAVAVVHGLLVHLEVAAGGDLLVALITVKLLLLMRLQDVVVEAHVVLAVLLAALVAEIDNVAVLGLHVLFQLLQPDVGAVTEITVEDGVLALAFQWLHTCILTVNF